MYQKKHNGPAPADQDIITKEELANRLGLPSVRVVDQWIRKKAISHFKWGHRTVRVSYKRACEELARYEVKAVASR